MLKVSIITVCLNEVDRIECTIRSIIDQTYKNIEFMVIDGGSTDGTLDILNRYSKYIDIFIPNHNHGVYRAMNEGIAVASGEYIYFMNGGDCFKSPDVLTRIFGNTPDADILYGNIITNNANGSSRIKTPPPNVGMDYLSYRTLPHQASLTKKNLFIKTGFFDESYLITADYEFFLRAIVKYSASTLYFPFTFAIWFDDGISSNDKHQKLREAERKRAQKNYLPYKYYLIARKRYHFPSRNNSFFFKKIIRYKKYFQKLLLHD